MSKKRIFLESIKGLFGEMQKNKGILEGLGAALTGALNAYQMAETEKILEVFDKEEKAQKLSSTREIEEAKYLQAESLEREKAIHERKMRDLRQSSETSRQEAERQYAASKSDALRVLEEMERNHPAQWLPWSAPYWEDYVPSRSFDSPPVTRFGSMVIKGKRDSIHVPALLPIITHKNVLINAGGSAKEAALDGLRAMILRLLVTIPAGKLNLVMLDPVGLGSNMAGFMHLPENLVGKKIWTEPAHIEQQLADLSSHMEMVIQKYLRNDYPSMEDYNKKAGEVAEPYRVLAVANFPANFTEASAQRLISIASNGPRTGVYVLVMRDTELKLPYNFRIEELERLSTVIDQTGSQFALGDKGMLHFPINMDSLPPPSLLEKLLKKIGDESKSASTVEVPFKLALERIAGRWIKDAETRLLAPIGRAGARDLQDFVVGGPGTLQHALVAGRTGSGKSNLLHVLIMSLCESYPPEELELYMIDFKQGVEFKTYAENGLPHAKVIAIQSEREFGLSVLQGLDAELQKRGELFKKCGVQKLEEYRQKTVKAEQAGMPRLPRIVLLVDEFQEFFTEDDSIRSQATLLLDRLVRLGRYPGIHVVLASQTLAGPYTLPRTTLDQMAIRIALQCSDADSRVILGQDNPAARLLGRPGEAYYNDKNGLIEGNTLFQVFMLPDHERESYLKEMVLLAEKRKTFPRAHPIVFEGNAPSDISTNLALESLLSGKATALSYSSLSAWLGEPIAIKPHTAAVFQRQSRSNLLIVAQNEEASASMMIAALLGLAAQRQKDQVEFHVIDLTKADSPWNQMLNALPGILPHRLLIHKRTAIPLAVESIHQVLKIREESGEEKKDKDIFLFIAGIQRAAALRSEDGYTYPESTTKLQNLLNAGPDYGIHLVCWGDTVKSVERVLGRSLSEFDLRVAMQMSVMDSNQLLDSDAAHKLGAHRALLFNEEKVGALEKFRPYGLPAMELLHKVGAGLKERHGQLGAPKDGFRGKLSPAIKSLRP